MHTHGGDIYRNPGMLDFSANINWRGMPEAVANAAREAMSACAPYPDTQCTKLAQAVHEMEQVPKEWLLFGNGAADLIFGLVLALRPRRALVCAPGFYEYEQALRTVDCEIVRYYLKEEHKFRIQEDFLDWIQEDLDLVFVCNPNNPTGIVTQKQFMKQVLHRCENNKVMLLVDECFQDFLKYPQQDTLKDALEQSSYLFLLKAFTKMYGMAGLRLGYGMCSSEKVRAQMAKVRQPWSVSTPAQAAGVAAAKETAFAQRTRQEIATERAFLKDGLKKAGYPVLGGSANFIFFKGPANLAEACKNRNILIRDCSNYEGLTPGYFRIAVRNHKDNEHLLEVLGTIETHGE